jgi:hypothetical protein
MRLATTWCLADAWTKRECQASGRNTVAADACFQITWPEACRFTGAWKTKKLYLRHRQASRRNGMVLCSGVHTHASIGADAVGIEEFRHRCPVSGIIFSSASLRCGQSDIFLPLFSIFWPILLWHARHVMKWTDKWKWYHFGIISLYLSIAMYNVLLNLISI